MPTVRSKVGALHAELNHLAIKITNDPRRLQAVKSDCAAIINDVQARAQQAGTVKNIADPGRDLSFALSWLATLTDDQITMLKDAMKQDAAKRRKKK